MKATVHKFMLNHYSFLFYCELKYSLLLSFRIQISESSIFIVLLMRTDQVDIIILIQRRIRSSMKVTSIWQLHFIVSINRPINYSLGKINVIYIVTCICILLQVGFYEITFILLKLPRTVKKNMLIIYFVRIYTNVYFNIPLYD